MPDRFLQDVITNLEYQSAWVEIGRYFLRIRPDGKEAPFVQRMLDAKQEMVNLLSRTLRQQDYAPSRVQPNSALLEQAKKRRTPETVLRYIHHGILMSLDWYQERLQNRNHPFQTLWQELYEMEAALKVDVEQVLHIKNG
jgi:hypothetical protein